MKLFLRMALKALCNLTCVLLPPNSPMLVCS
ncbi:hypothetical protein MED222_06330 [Vibrio sp. MED222]|nr:hypothetical protein MED222_06330 [Vibrio sp. MED222]